MTRDEAVIKVRNSRTTSPHAVRGADELVDALICLDILRVEEPPVDVNDLAKRALKGHIVSTYDGKYLSEYGATQVIAALVTAGFMILKVNK
jgi:hypothetical protein